ncbi:hypothetical protein [Oerskovia flava]|uniref:hypothetical protein n=1 Tax=Oerskovia flava TaxID=2986422 RepID=UPI003CCCC407
MAGSGSRARQTVHAVRGIDVDVAPGGPVAVLGPNGAGRTTTLRMRRRVWTVVAVTTATVGLTEGIRTMVRATD